MKTITVITPKSNNLDGSIGNSIFMWAQAYYLNYKCNFEYKIILDYSTWSELNLVEFPYTELGNIEISANYHIIDCNLIKEVLLNDNIKNFIKHDHLVIDKWYIFDNNVILDDDQKKINFTYDDIDPISLIKFKDVALEDFFRKEFSDFISIHIRRYHGVIISESNLTTLPEEIQYDFYCQYLNDCKIYYNNWPTASYKHPFIDDKQFYKVIDTALGFNKNQKFYISTDIPKTYYRYYFDKYQNIFDKYSYLKTFENLIKESYDENILNFDENVTNIKYYYNKKSHLVLGNLLDLFALSNSKLLVRSYMSSWSIVAKRLRNTSNIILPLSDKYNLSTKTQHLNSIIKSVM